MAARRTSNEFEKSFQQLEKIVQRLEAEELPLDESLQLFEEGIRLSRFCHQRLEEVEKKIELILADAKGQPVTEPFEEGMDCCSILRPVLVHTATAPHEGAPLPENTVGTALTVVPDQLPRSASSSTSRTISTLAPVVSAVKISNTSPSYLSGEPSRTT